ncbi:YbfB/YjiJ family MFS transporter [Roseibium sp. CAU 1637]|uniref:YbfB/YjiJ family MFS transporter n=1 Tax=Roseibium limicola TaxID=2816037 RepID=A0A939EQ05_9HYPH|nr:MFS transporter [Roseibium limicola]MBO0345393.1 YbfB/YjiJ family MFS transporter [Roseibium limicola]
MTRPFTSSSPAGLEPPLLKARGLTAAGLAIVAATYGLARYCFGLFLPDIRDEFQLATETVGLIAGSSYIGYLAATFIGSWLSTTYGPRLPIILGGLAATLGMGIIALSTTPLILAAGVFIAGTSPGLSYPPFSDVIVRHTESSRQNTVYAWINSGTGFGVAIAGPLALYAGQDWRLAWFAFAALALMITVWNLIVLPPPQPTRRQRSIGVPTHVLMRRENGPLFTAALIFGVVTAIYWTYAVELLHTLTDDPQAPILFWIILGVAGISGCFAGGVVDRWGLRRAYFALVILVGLAVASLPLLIQAPAGIYFSAACFGSGFIVMTALFGIWSMGVCRDMPSIGFGMTFFLISLGQGVGPVLGGYLIPVFGEPNLFLAAGLLCFSLASLAPGKSYAPTNSEQA